MAFACWVLDGTGGYVSRSRINARTVRPTFDDACCAGAPRNRAPPSAPVRFAPEGSGSDVAPGRLLFHGVQSASQAARKKPTRSRMKDGISFFRSFCVSPSRDWKRIGSKIKSRKIWAVA